MAKAARKIASSKANLIAQGLTQTELTSIASNGSYIVEKCLAKKLYLLELKCLKAL